MAKSRRYTPVNLTTGARRFLKEIESVGQPEFRNREFSNVSFLPAALREAGSLIGGTATLSCFDTGVSDMWGDRIYQAPSGLLFTHGVIQGEQIPHLRYYVHEHEPDKRFEIGDLRALMQRYVDASTEGLELFAFVRSTRNLLGIKHWGERPAHLIVRCRYLGTDDDGFPMFTAEDGTDFIYSSPDGHGPWFEAPSRWPELRPSPMDPSLQAKSLSLEMLAKLFDLLMITLDDKAVAETSLKKHQVVWRIGEDQLKILAQFTNPKAVAPFLLHMGRYLSAIRTVRSDLGGTAWDAVIPDAVKFANFYHEQAAKRLAMRTRQP